MFLARILISVLRNQWNEMKQNTSLSCLTTLNLCYIESVWTGTMGSPTAKVEEAFIKEPGFTSQFTAHLDINVCIEYSRSSGFHPFDNYFQNLAIDKLMLLEAVSNVKLFLKVVSAVPHSSYSVWSKPPCAGPYQDSGITTRLKLMTFPSSLLSCEVYLSRNRRARQSSSTSDPNWRNWLKRVRRSGTYEKGSTNRDSSSSL